MPGNVVRLPNRRATADAVNAWCEVEALTAEIRTDVEAEIREAWQRDRSPVSMRRWQRVWRRLGQLEALGRTWAAASEGGRTA
jgi:hypothetical protein